MRTFEKIVDAKIRGLLLMACVILVAASCVDPIPEPLVLDDITVGAYILNNGNYTDNDSNISYLDFSSDAVTEDIFTIMNHKNLGNLGQDMMIFGDKMYITVDGSGVVFVTDIYGNIIKEIVHKENGETLSPRYLTSYGDAIYVSYYQGYIGKIDTVDFNLQIAPCGPNPDQIAVSKGKLYVATSGGLSYPDYCSTIDVFDAKDLSGRKTIDVVINPQFLEVNSAGEVFLISTGNYADIPSTLQKIDPITNEVNIVSEIQSPGLMTMADDRLYVVTKSYDETWNTVCNYLIYNTISNSVEGEMIENDTLIKNACSIDINPDNGEIYIGDSDYISNGDLYRFSSKGAFIKKYDTGGLNPMRVCFVKL